MAWVVKKLEKLFTKEKSLSRDEPEEKGLANNKFLSFWICVVATAFVLRF